MPLDLNGFCHARRTIRAHKASSESLTFIPSMRSTFAGFQLAVTVCLAIVPFISATPTHSQPSRRGTPSIDTPVNGFFSLGCVHLFDAQGTMPLRTQVRLPGDNSEDNCTKACLDANQGYIYAGLTGGTRCFCDTSFVGTGNLDIVRCQQYPCSANDNQACGGDSAMVLYNLSQTGN